MNSKDLNNQLNQHPPSSTQGRSKKDGQTHNYFSSVRHEISTNLQGQLVIQKTPSVFQTNPGAGGHNYSKSQFQDELISEMISIPQQQLQSQQQPTALVACTTLSQQNNQKQSPSYYNHNCFCSLKNIPQTQQQLQQSKQNQGNHLDAAQVSCLTQINNQDEYSKNNQKEDYLNETPSVQMNNNHAGNEELADEKEKEDEEQKKNQQNNNNNNSNSMGMHFEDEQHYDKSELEDNNERVQDYQEDSQYVQSQQICMEDLIDEEEIESSDKKFNKNMQNIEKENDKDINNNQQIPQEISLNHGDQMVILRKRNTRELNQQKQVEQQQNNNKNIRNDNLEPYQQPEQVDLVLQQYNNELHLDQELLRNNEGKVNADYSCSLSEPNNTCREGDSSGYTNIVNNVFRFPHHDGVFSKQIKQKLQQQQQLDGQRQQLLPSPSVSESCCCQTPLSQNESKNIATDGFVLDDHKPQQTILISPSSSAASFHHNSPHFSFINSNTKNISQQQQDQEGITKIISTVASTQAKTARTEIVITEIKQNGNSPKLNFSQKQRIIYITEPESNITTVDKQLKEKDVNQKYYYPKKRTQCKSATSPQKVLQEQLCQKKDSSFPRNIPIPFDNSSNSQKKTNLSKQLEGDKDMYLAEDKQSSEENNCTNQPKQLELSEQNKQYYVSYFCDSNQIDGQSQKIPESLCFPSALLKHHKITPHDSLITSNIQSFNNQKYLIDEEPSPAESACQVFQNKQCQFYPTPLEVEEEFKEIKLYSPSSLNSIKDNTNPFFSIPGKNKSHSKTRQISNIEGDEITNSKYALKYLKRHNSSQLSQEQMNTSDNQFFQQSFLPLRGGISGNSQRTHPQLFNLTPSAATGIPQLEPTTIALHSPITVSSATSCLRPNHGICSSTESFRQNSHTQNNVMADKAPHERIPNFFNKETTDYTPSYLRRINSSHQRQLPNMNRNNSIYSQQLNDHCKLSNNNIKTEKYYLTSMGTHNFPTGAISQTLKDPINENITMTNFTVPYGYFFEKRYCQVCNIDQPLRSKHCVICKHCVSTYDHHCPWIGTCIAQRNRFHFFLFAFFHTFLSSYIILKLVSFLSAAERSQSAEIVVASIGVIFIGYVFSMTFLLCIQHTYYILTNITTCKIRLLSYLLVFVDQIDKLFKSGEYYSWEKITYLKDQPKHLGSPFSFGAIKNIQSLFKSSFSKAGFDWEINKVRLPALANNLTIQP